MPSIDRRAFLITGAACAAGVLLNSCAQPDKPLTENLLGLDEDPDALDDVSPIATAAVIPGTGRGVHLQSIGSSRNLFALCRPSSGNAIRMTPVKENGFDWQFATFTLQIGPTFSHQATYTINFEFGGTTYRLRHRDFSIFADPYSTDAQFQHDSAFQITDGFRGVGTISLRGHIWHPEDPTSINDELWVARGAGGVLVAVRKPSATADLRRFKKAASFFLFD